MTADDTVTFALLGAGVAAEFNRRAIEANAKQGARLEAVVHYDPDRFEAISRSLGAPCISEEAMLEREDIDAVCICTPSGQHAGQAVRAARAGKHVLVEKPMALTLEDADRMIAACEQAGVQLGVIFQRRAEPLYRRIHEAIAAGDLGDLTLGVVTVPYARDQDYYDSADWRGTWTQDGGGAVMNQGIHLVDLLVWYLGDPAEVCSQGATLHRDIEVEDALAASLRFENGALATFAATTTAAPGFPHRLEIYGTQGGIQVEGENVVRWERAATESTFPESPLPGQAEGAGSGGDPKGIGLTGHVGIVRDFLSAVREGRTPLVDGGEGRRSLVAVLAMYQRAGLLEPSL